MVSRAYASFAVVIPFLKVVSVNKVANVTMLEFVDIKVAKIKLAHLKLLIGLYQLKLQNYWWGFEKRPFDFVWFCWKIEFWRIFLYLLVIHLIFSIALLFELLMYWWRNRWVELYWYKLFMCGNAVFGCFEKLLFAEFVLFNVLTVSALSKICLKVEFWCIFI